MISFGFFLLFGLNFMMNQRIETSSNDSKTRTELLFEQFCMDYNKSYHTRHEYVVRMGIFVKNLETINRHNSNVTNAFKMAINQFADMTYRELYDLNYATDESYSKMDKSKLIEPVFEDISSDAFDDEDVPHAFDWREAGIVSRVKDQGICGSCFAYAVLEEIESQLLMKTKKLYEFSRQEIVDCARDGWGSLGCSGGLLYGVHSYITARGGLADEKSYPYQAKESECRRDISPINFTLSGVIRTFETDDEEILRKMLFNFGPVIAIVDNLHDSFFRYSSGVYYEPECNDSEVYSHAIVIVGYGSENGADYWTIKNSYGARWGEGGYMRIARNRDNHCNIAAFNMVTKL